jgi:hypothetical protein
MVMTAAVINARKEALRADVINCSPVQIKRRGNQRHSGCRKLPPVAAQISSNRPYSKRRCAVPSPAKTGHDRNLTGTVQ